MKPGLPPSVRVTPRAALGGAALIVGGVLYAWVAAGTTPFSRGADVMTAVPIGVAAASAALVRGRSRSKVRVTVETAGDGPRVWPWVALLLAVIALELFTYLFGGSDRYAYPTVSSLYDQASQYRGVKTLFFFLWLAIGWALVTP